jgi:hypothetical protein
MKNIYDKILDYILIYIYLYIGSKINDNIIFTDMLIDHKIDSVLTLQINISYNKLKKIQQALNNKNKVNDDEIIIFINSFTKDKFKLLFIDNKAMSIHNLLKIIIIRDIYL